MPTLEDNSPTQDALRMRIARVQLAIDDAFRTTNAAPDSPERAQRMSALSTAQGRLSAAETMAYGASVTADEGARLRAGYELSRLEAELGIGQDASRPN